MLRAPRASNPYVTTSDVKNKLRRHLPLIFTVIGMFLLGFVGSEYYGMYREQKRLTVEWEQQNVAPKPGEAKPAHDGLTRLEIPKISLDAIVLEGASRKQLKLGPGRITTTAVPGETGNSVITAHRDTFFRHIYELAKGDEILVRRNGELFRYKVTGKKVVDPADLSVLKQTNDSQLTLITCYPTYFIGPAPERLVVFSKMDPSGAVSTSAAASN
jgi:sortase A